MGEITIRQPHDGDVRVCSSSSTESSSRARRTLDLCSLVARQAGDKHLSIGSAESGAGIPSRTCTKGAVVALSDVEHIRC